MATGTWSFALSFLVFLLIVFISEATAARLRYFLSMPLLFGAIFFAGFALGWLPQDMLVSSNMVSVGTIAFNVLVIHSGTLIDFGLLWRRRRETALCLLSAAVMTAMLLLLLPKFIGRELALLAPGAVVGGGASCAIGSRWSALKNPEISFFPWLIFMFQGLFAIPVLSWAMKREAARLCRQGDGSQVQPQAGGGLTSCRGFVGQIPGRYKTTAYYLSTIMAVAMVNQLLQSTLLKNTAVNPNITALLLGMAMGNLGWMDKGPLFRSDSYGLLIISLMGLMANNLAHIAPAILWKLVGPALLALALGNGILWLCGWLLAKPLGLSPYAGIICVANSVMGFPVNRQLAADTAATLPERFCAAAEGELLGLLNVGTVTVSNGLSILIVGIVSVLL